MVEAWRIVKEKHAATALTGEGSAKTGGRWNSRGVRVVYASGWKSLAVLENLVHLNPPVRFKYVALRLKFDEALIEVFPRKALPRKWRVEPPPTSTQVLGNLWVQEARSAVLALPSVIIPEEFNFLLNPAHPDFPKISIGKPERFEFDPRLLI
jgi:RES domain-containing protein